MLQRCLRRRSARVWTSGTHAAGAARTAHDAVASTAAGAPTQPLTEAPPGPRAAYVHLPFCKRKCFYCDFPVEAVGRPDRPREGVPLRAVAQRVRLHCQPLPYCSSQSAPCQLQLTRKP
jgi:hypothetical protein